MCSPLRIIGTALPAAMHARRHAHERSGRRELRSRVRDRRTGHAAGRPHPAGHSFYMCRRGAAAARGFQGIEPDSHSALGYAAGRKRTTDDGAALGRVLFHDRRLSITNTVACASCHQREHGFASPERFNTGAIGVPLPRNAMALANGPNYRPRRSTRRCSMTPSVRRRSPATAIRSNNAGGVCRTPQPPRTPKLLCARPWNRMRGSFVSPCMRRRSPFAAAGMVLGAVVCIMMLAYLAACGGKGF